MTLNVDLSEHRELKRTVWRWFHMNLTKTERVMTKICFLLFCDDLDLWPGLSQNLNRLVLG